MRAYFDHRGHYRGTSVGCGGLSVLLFLPALLFVAAMAVVFCWPLLVIHHGPAWRLIAEVGWLALLVGVRVWLGRWWRRFDTLENWPRQRGGYK